MGGGVRLLTMEILIVRSSNEFDEPDYSAVHVMCPGFGRLAGKFFTRDGNSPVGRR